jgi:hypothetical protein
MMSPWLMGSQCSGSVPVRPWWQYRTASKRLSKICQMYSSGTSVSGAWFFSRQAWNVPVSQVFSAREITVSNLHDVRGTGEFVHYVGFALGEAGVHTFRR